MTSRIGFHMRRQLHTQNLHCKDVNKAKKVTFCCKMLSFQLITQLNCVITVENILTRANYFNLSDPTVVLYWRAGRGLEISKRNRGIPPLVQAIMARANRPLSYSLQNSLYLQCQELKSVISFNAILLLSGGKFQTQVCLSCLLPPCPGGPILKVVHDIIVQKSQINFQGHTPFPKWQYLRTHN